MKKLLVLMLAITSLLSGCYIYGDPYREGGGHRDDRDGGSHRDRDHDRDGHDERRLNDSSRY
jgi:hypothetical protein